MPIGTNAPIVDRLIKRTDENRDEKTGKTSETPQKESNISKKSITSKKLSGKENATLNTVKMTFYIKQEFLEQLYNYAYWDRLSVTEAFNIALFDGLKNKTTKPRK